MSEKRALFLLGELSGKGSSLGSTKKPVALEANSIDGAGFISLFR